MRADNRDNGVPEQRGITRIRALNPFKAGGITRLYAKWGHKSLLFTLICIAWLAWRVGTKPSRLTYPCSQFALSQVTLFYGSISLPIMGVFHNGVSYFRRGEYKKIIFILLAFLLLMGITRLYGDYQNSQLKIAGSGTIPAASWSSEPGLPGGMPGTDSLSFQFPSSLSTDHAVVSFSHDPSVYYGGGPPYDQADNPAYDLVWETVERLHLGSHENPLNDIIQEGDTVLLKPNWVGFGDGTHTRAEVVRPLIDMAIAAGATSIYVGDGGEDVDSTDYVMDSAGYKDMVDILQTRYPAIEIRTLNLNMRDDGWHWVHLGRETSSNSSFAGSGYTDYDVGTGYTGTLYNHPYYQASDNQSVNPGGECLGWYAVNDYVLDADVIINVPKLKTHQEMMATIALKNFVGLTLTSTYDDANHMERIPHHHYDPVETNFFNNDIFWRAILDMNKIVLYTDEDGVLQSTQQRQYLTVVDAIQSMEKSQHHDYGNGIPYDTYAVLAGVDPVAIDAVGCRIMGYDYNVINSISNADSDVMHPIGTNDPDSIVIVGDVIDAGIDHIFMYNENWGDYASSLPVTDFAPPQIQSVTRPDNVVNANITDCFAAYLLYETGGTEYIEQMSQSGTIYTADIPAEVTGYQVIAQDDSFNSVQADFSATLALVPDSGPPFSSVVFSGSGFPASTSGRVFFDANNDGVWNIGERVFYPTTDENGDLPGTSMSVPQVAAGDYPIIADIPQDDTADAAATFTVTGVLVTSPTSGVAGSQTTITISTCGFAANSSGYVWFDSNGNNLLDGEETSVTLSTNEKGIITANTPLTIPPFVDAGDYFIRADIPSGGDIEASTGFTILPGIDIDPATGTMDTATAITITGGSFDSDTSGYVWFDTDSDGVMDGEEPYLEVTSTSGGELPAGTTLVSLLLPPNGTYPVRADIPSGGDIEASVIFKIEPVTTSIIVTKYDAYGGVISQVTKTWEEMQSEMPVYGDETTHFYLQGISGNTSIPWDPTESINLKDWGTNQGTDVKDICELVGGMSPGDVVEMVASDGWSKTYDYELVYEPDPRQGKMLLCWWNDGLSVPDFYEGMRMVFAADTSTNPWGYQCFGNQDQYDCFPESRWYYYSANQPTTTGHSGKYIYRINIYEPSLYTCDGGGNPVDSFSSGETVYVTGKGLSSLTSYNLWVQPEPVVSGDTLVEDDDPSGSRETVATDGNGDFGPEAVWTISSGDIGSGFDVIADSQAAGTVGVFDSFDAIDNPGFQGAEVMEFISFTITDYSGDGVNFGSLDPGIVNQPADGQPDQGAVTVTVGAETSVPVIIRIRGDDFEGAATMAVTTVTYNDENNAAEAIALDNDYATVFSVPAGTEFISWLFFWISIPSGQTAGEYITTFYFEAVEAE